MADDRELLEAELQALMEASADFSKGLSTVASRMRAIKSYLNSNVKTITTSPSSRAKVRTRDSATSPIIFRTTRCTSVSPDRFSNTSSVSLLDTTNIKMEKDDDIYDEHHAVDNRRLEMEQRIRRERKEQEKAICSVGDICSVTRAGGLNVLTSGTSGVTATRIISTTGGQISNKASLLKVANAAAAAAAAGGSGTPSSAKNPNKPSGLIYILKPVGNGKSVPTPVKFNSFNTVKKMRRILPSHNTINRVGSMSIMMDRSRQRIIPKNRNIIITTDNSSANSKATKNLEEDIVYAIRRNNKTPEIIPSSVESIADTENVDLSPKNRISDSEMNQSQEESDTSKLEKEITNSPEKVVSSNPKNENSVSSSEVTTNEDENTKRTLTPVINSSVNESLSTSSPEAQSNDKDTIKEEPVKRRPGRRKHIFKTEEERKEYNRLRQAKYRAIKRQSSDSFEPTLPINKSRRTRKSIPLSPKETTPPKRPLILRQKRERSTIDKNT